jgi:hypothetical protein
MFAVMAVMVSDPDQNEETDGFRLILKNIFYGGLPQ